MTSNRPEPPPPLHSDHHSRTRPTRRRALPRSNRQLERRRAALSKWTLIFGVLVGVSAIGAALMARDDGPAPLEATDLVAPSSAVPVQVAEIVDGDTLHVVAVDGTELTVRLFGVDTPERGEACYAEATARLAALAGSEVLLLPDVRLEDRGGRALRYVFTAEGASIDAALVDEGLAVAWRDDGAYRDQIVALEDTARSAGTGCLWGG